MFVFEWSGLDSVSPCLGLSLDSVSHDLVSVKVVLTTTLWIPNETNIVLYKLVSCSQWYTHADTNKQVGRQGDQQAIFTDRQAAKQTDRLTDSQADRQAAKQTDRQANLTCTSCSLQEVPCGAAPGGTG